MVDTNKLRGIIASKGLSQSKVAKELGLSDKTFYTKMKTGVFNSAEMEAMIELLHIDNPTEVFFAKFVAY